NSLSYERALKASDNIVAVTWKPGSARSCEMMGSGAACCNHCLKHQELYLISVPCSVCVHHREQRRSNQHSPKGPQNSKHDRREDGRPDWNLGGSCHYERLEQQAMNHDNDGIKN